MKLRKRTWIIGGVIAALLGTGAIAARYHGHSMEDRAHFATYMITKKLELNDEQEANLDKLAASWIDQRSSMKDFRKSMMEEIKSLANGDDISVDQITSLREKAVSQFASRADTMIPQFVAFYNSLDDTQRAKVSERLDQMAERMEKRGKRGGHGWYGKRHGSDSE